MVHEAARAAAARGAIGPAAGLAEQAISLTPPEDPDLFQRRLDASAYEIRGGETAMLIESLGTLCHYETYIGSITPGLLERAVELERAAPRPSNNYSPREILGLRLM